MTDVKIHASGRAAPDQPPPYKAAPPPLRAGIERRGAGPGGLYRGMLGFVLSHEQFPIGELLQYGAAAERAGFDLLSASDHLQPWQDNEGHASAAWVTLAALSQLTRNIRMGTAVTCPTLRYHPAVVAQAFASLSQLSPGRIFLGLGSGEALNEEAATGTWPDWDSRSERLIEATQLIRELWSGRPLDHHGAHYQLKMKLYDLPAGSVPILLAANGPKAMHRAGRYGDGLITDPETWREHRAEFQAGAQAAGRSADTMPVLAELFVVVGGKREARPAAERWRFLPKAFQGYHDIADPRTIRQRAEREIPLEQVYEQWTISADADAHIERIVELFESGVTIVNVHSGQADQQRVLEFYRTEVLPEVRKTLDRNAAATRQPLTN